MTTIHPILHVEDREDDVFLLKRALNRAGISNPIQVATNGQEAVDYLARAAEANSGERLLPCLVLLDLKLPFRNGFEVLEWIRGQPQLRSVIVIVLTSSIHKSDIERAYTLGANAFLVKPSDPDTLIDMCKALKHFWLTHNSPPVELA